MECYKRPFIESSKDAPFIVLATLEENVKNAMNVYKIDAVFRGDITPEKLVLIDDFESNYAIHGSSNVYLEKKTTILYGLFESPKSKTKNGLKENNVVNKNTKRVFVASVCLGFRVIKSADDKDLEVLINNSIGVEK